LPITGTIDLLLILKINDFQLNLSILGDYALIENDIQGEIQTIAFPMIELPVMGIGY
jgi:hypothetical protein